ncbi:hypothetical protein LR48_Vigan03g028900 [Vigna angularis]|uniref:BAH domain-containing protein n=1 Tax=Phaseolus angularis TaxID=3914 RepID=A0A0L9U255_PHAAN|nr:hypothetical protein LR48_Vigan03g028900 [Vigna angularis]
MVSEPKVLLKKKLLLSLPLHPPLSTVALFTTAGAVVYRCHYRSLSFDRRSYDFDRLSQATTTSLTTPSSELLRSSCVVACLVSSQADIQSIEVALVPCLDNLGYFNVSLSCSSMASSVGVSSDLLCLFEYFLKNIVYLGKKFPKLAVRVFFSLFKLLPHPLRNHCPLFQSPSMAAPMEEDGLNYEFAWGRKRGMGGKKKDVRFYEFFTFDGVQYVLNDTIYLQNESCDMPHIGKLIKVWENHDKLRKVKGFANVNPLEAIVGKCNVICISKNIGNSQPKDDFVFYRFFDVGQRKVVDQIDDKIVGTESLVLLRKHFLVSLPPPLPLSAVTSSIVVGGVIVYCYHYRSSSFDRRSHDFDCLGQATTMPLSMPSSELLHALSTF